MFNLLKRPHSKQCRERVEAAIEEKDPDAPTLQRRDERHIRWAEAEEAASRDANPGDMAAAQRPWPGTPARSELRPASPRRGGHAGGDEDMAAEKLQALVEERDDDIDAHATPVADSDSDNDSDVMDIDAE